jgi:hypothetical protein
VVKLILDHPLTDWGSRIPKPFSSDNTPLVLCCYLHVFHQRYLYADCLCLPIAGAYPKISADIILSNNDNTTNDVAGAYPKMSKGTLAQLWLVRIYQPCLLPPIGSKPYLLRVLKDGSALALPQSSLVQVVMLHR